MTPCVIIIWALCGICLVINYSRMGEKKRADKLQLKLKMLRTQVGVLTEDINNINNIYVSRIDQLEKE